MKILVMRMKERRKEKLDTSKMKSFFIILNIVGLSQLSATYFSVSVSKPRDHLLTFS